MSCNLTTSFKYDSISVCLFVEKYVRDICIRVVLSRLRIKVTNLVNKGEGWCELVCSFRWAKLML